MLYYSLFINKFEMSKEAWGSGKAGTTSAPVQKA